MQFNIQKVQSDFYSLRNIISLEDSFISDEGRQLNLVETGIESQGHRARYVHPLLTIATVSRKKKLKRLEPRGFTDNLFCPPLSFDKALSKLSIQHSYQRTIRMTLTTCRSRIQIFKWKSTLD